MRTDQIRARFLLYQIWGAAISLLPLVVCLMLALATSLQASTQTRKTRRAIDDKKFTPAKKEVYCGADVCPMQVLVKFTGCPAQPDIKLLAERLRGFSRTFAQDNFLDINQVGRGCLFLARSSKLNVRELIQLFTRLKANRSDRVNSLLNSFGLSDINVDYTEPNFMIKFDSDEDIQPAGKVPNDDYFRRDKLWGLSNKAFPGMDIDAVRAWGYSTGSDKIVVGVVDTGIFYEHPDLVDNMWNAPRGFDVVLGGETIHCGKGSHGFNALGKTHEEKCNPQDDSGHGTLVAGIIGARGDNRIGVVGTNWTVKLMGLKIGDRTGTCLSNAITAFDFAFQVQEQLGSEANLRVLNNSWGYLYDSNGCEVKSKALMEKVEEAKQHDMLVVASAGQNDGNDNDLRPHYPSGFDLSNVLSVTAIDEEGALTTIQGNTCNHGKKSVHLGAPGYGIWSTYTPPRWYYHGSLTSMAAPFVSGAAALMLSVPNCAKLHAPDLKRLILKGAVFTPSLVNMTETEGRLNLYESIRLCRQ